jgi:hypothetical protein
MILYSHRLHGVLQQMVGELGLDVIMADENSPVSLSDHESMLNDVAAGLNIEMKKLSGTNGSILYRFRRRS